MSVIRLSPREWKADLVKDQETGEWVKTNIVYSPPFYPMCLYPSVHLRYHLFAFAWKDAPEGYEWRHYMGPVAGIVSLIGLPGDALVDTVFLYWDIDTVKTALPCAMCNEVIPPKKKEE